MKITKSWKISVALVLGLLSLTTVISRAADDYVVIVNKANPAESISSG